MAVYKIFPEKDATLYSQYPTKNTGLDPILELTNTYDTSTPHTSRFLIQFATEEINDVVNNIIDGDFESNLKCYLAEVTGLNTDTTLKVHPVSRSWDMGTGRFDNDPHTTNGCGWQYSKSSGSGEWTNIGGDFIIEPSMSFSQSLGYSDNKDLNINVTSVIKEFYSGNLNNYGFLVKYADSDEQQANKAKVSSLKYFSIDTHTIYPPQLEFKWRDYTFDTGSSTNNIINTSKLVATLDNNKNNFRRDSVHKFYINCRPQFPTRVFKTSSLYTTNHYLPTASYYAVKDLHTNEFIINYDTNYTQISADEEGSYFKLYMNGLEPERYYQILIKTEIGGNTLILDDNYYFKVING